MRVDGNIDGTAGADLAGIADQVATAERVGDDGVWTTEVSRDPFLPLLLAADRSCRTFDDSAVPVSARHPGKLCSGPRTLTAELPGQGVRADRGHMPAVGGTIQEARLRGTGEVAGSR